jgi:hypothetical protein
MSARSEGIDSKTRRDRRPDVTEDPTISEDDISDKNISDSNERVRQVLQQVVDRTPAEQAAYLDEHCLDPDLRAEIDRRLDHDRSHGGLLAAGIDALEPAPLEEVDEETRKMWHEAGRIWDLYEDRREFRAFVAADYGEVYQALARLRGRVSTVLEWGSGLGVITIMASNLGFDAYGIESESRLVECARELAKRYGPRAQFAAGNYIPADYEWSAEHGDESFRSDVEVEPGYESLDMELRDFDVVYVYPWPDELDLCHDIMRQCGGENALFLSYDGREGISIRRLGRYQE